MTQLAGPVPPFMRSATDSYWTCFSMMQHRPNPDPSRAEGAPATSAPPHASAIPAEASRCTIDIDLTDANIQRKLATKLHRLLETRASAGGTCTQYLKELQRHDLPTLQQKGIVFIPELQIEVVRAVAHGNESGCAEAILKTIAQLEGSIHCDALVVLADLGSAGYGAVRSCLVSLARSSSNPKDLFIGHLGSKFLAIFGDRREIRFMHDPTDVIKSCADFMQIRLGFVMNAGEAIPRDLRAEAFCETVTFLARDLSRGRGLRFGQALRIFEEYDLTAMVDEVVKRCATSFGGRCKKLLLLFAHPCVRIKSLFPMIDKNVLARGFREVFMKRFAPRPE